MAADASVAARERRERTDYALNLDVAQFEAMGHETPLTSVYAMVAQYFQEEERNKGGAFSSVVTEEGEISWTAFLEEEHPLVARADRRVHRRGADARTREASASGHWRARGARVSVHPHACGAPGAVRHGRASRLLLRAGSRTSKAAHAAPERPVDPAPRSRARPKIGRR